jgi:2-oxoglutarate dehydrogenase complex dehydrogenase (E1) component-like enzyme
LEEIERACRQAEKIQEALSQAISLAEEMKGSMSRLAHEELFAAAVRREQLNAEVTTCTAEMGDVLHALARKQGWNEMTIARLKGIAPGPAARLQAALALVNERAAKLRNQDDANRARGARAMAFLRSALAPHGSGPSTYDRRGAAAAQPITTASRTA